MDNNLITSFKESDCDDTSKLYTKKCNTLLLKKEILERDYLQENADENDTLYPEINDPLFNVKIATRKEFNDYKYDGAIHDIKTRADELSNVPFELAPHQMFIKNYLSFQTPYNSLLLYHQLGTGKTCSAIGVTEEMRTYLKDVGITKRIIIVASPNVQENFKLQLFDERKLQLVNGLWKMDGCVGDKFIREINPTNVKDIPKEKIVSQIKTLIDKSYLFRGYEGFSNLINKVSGGDNPNVTENQIINNLRSEFSNRLIVIDEVHNIRTSQDNANKKVADQLTKMVKYVDNIRLLLLSATPMYNSVREIVWLLNLMNINDRRGKIDIKDVFDKKGEFKEGGEELLRRKSTGYISYVRGENPYTFPFRVYPDIFSPKNSFLELQYPSYQMNGKYIPSKNRLKSLKKTIYLTPISNYQENVYKIMINKMQKQISNAKNVEDEKDEMSIFQNLDSFNYTLLQSPLEALIITYPADGVNEFVENLDDIRKEMPVGEQEEVDDPPSQDENEDDEEAMFELKEKFQEKPNQKRQRCPNGTRFDKNEQECKPIEPVLSETDRETSQEQDISVTDDDTEIIESQDDNEEKVKVELTNKSSSERSIDSESYDELQKGGDDEDTLSSFVDVSSLTGKKGLNRIMRFVESYTPPTKGSFEYKTNKYGRIFSPDEISKYSSKLKFISDSIMKSEGIVLIYSQWIDSGLIPTALVLEELGFTRAIGKPLFEKPPTTPLDSITMTPKGSEEISSFSQAKYALISGDVRLSPNNTEEIKLLTNANNIDGKQVKVVLISKAASEGIDLKNVRQVHILEPWYTMSRIEQIIGRAVRSFSHQKLPFEKRNVEIFLHGTMLSDKEIEATDLYIYRLAEYKAKQIGEVSRVLKESAVDCLLNTEQNNFTQEQFNTNIIQTLSDGQSLDSFKVGDMPYSSMCDYMENCAVKCVPDKSISDKDVNHTTYGEGFIMINSEKIIQKIKQLMREEFFYKKSVLMAKINYPKVYPHVEIYSALTHLINDVTEVITDKYKRQGRLINIGDYYLFQPNELTNKNTSVFDRSVPVDYKPESIKLTPTKLEDKPKKKLALEKEKIATINEKIVTEQQIEQDKVDHNKEAISILTTIQENIDLTIEYSKGEKIQRMDRNYYKHMGAGMRKMEELLNIPPDRLYKFILEHAIDTLPYEQKKHLLNYVMTQETIDETSIVYKVKAYFDKFIIVDKYLSAIVLYNGNTRNIVVYDKKKNIWKEGEAEDERDLSKAITERYTVNTGKFNKQLGLISELVFKLKDATNTRSHGTTCQQTTKSKNIVVINKILNAEIFNKDNIKPLTDIGVCCIQELLLRYYNEVKPEKIWFVNSDTAKMYNL